MVEKRKKIVKKFAGLQILYTFAVPYSATSGIKRLIIRYLEFIK